jgi:hypothetical protein
MSIDTKKTLTVEQLDALMVPGEMVHTFIQAGSGPLLGADWKRSELLALAAENGAELAGDAATAMKHGAAVWDSRDGRKFPVFVATKPTGEEAENIIPFPVAPRPHAPTKTCPVCRGKGVESERIGRMYSEITCRTCRGEGKVNP